MAQRLTKSVVDSLKPSDKITIVFDAKLTGFGVAIYPSGQKSFVLQYRTAEGKQRRITISKMSDALTLEQARGKAVELSRGIGEDKDPLEHKRQRREAITVNELFDQYLASASFAEKAASTQYVDKGRIERHVRPLLGSEIADKVSGDAVKKAHRAISEGKTASTVKTKARGKAIVTGGTGTADKAILILRAAYSWAISEGILKDNPAAVVKVAQSGQRETIVTGPDEYAALFRALDRMETERRIRAPVADAIRVIALTGARNGEVSRLLWKYVDLRAGRIAIPATHHKTGKRTGKPRIINLPSEAQAIIARQAAGGPDDFVFAPAKGEGALALGKPWRQVRAEAGLPADLVLHGLRHSLASHLAMQGASNVELMQSLGHKQISTTMRYTHFAEQARSTLAERAASVAMVGLAEAQDKPKAEVVQLKK